MELGILWTFLSISVTIVTAVVPSLLPVEVGNTRLELITKYFHAGLKYAEIVVLLLCRHNIRLSLRHLKRLVSSLKLGRRHITYTPLDIVEDVIRKELQFSGDNIGYRSMWHRLQKDYQLDVKRNDVMKLLRKLDPEGVQLRKAHKLKRRMYSVPGPNYIWHVDGYDKLKPFGLCIHGAIDGYSRKVMWLEVGPTNNNPKMIARYYLDTVESHGFVPRIVRGDRGTENVNLNFLQPFFRHAHSDSMAGMKSFLYGKSSANQRIERWWGYLKQQGIHWWIIRLKDLRDRGKFDASNPVHVECLRFCATDVLQTELDRIAIHWNLHNIRPQKNTESCTGKPDVLFHAPELLGQTNYGKKVDLKDVSICKELYSMHKQICSDSFRDLVHIIKPDIHMPKNAKEAITLYESILADLEQELNR